MSPHARHVIFCLCGHQNAAASVDASLKLAAISQRLAAVEEKVERGGGGAGAAAAQLVVDSSEAAGATPAPRRGRPPKTPKTDGGAAAAETPQRNEPTDGSAPTLTELGAGLLVELGYGGLSQESAFELAVAKVNRYCAPRCILSTPPPSLLRRCRALSCSFSASTRRCLERIAISTVVAAKKKSGATDQDRERLVDEARQNINMTVRANDALLLPPLFALCPSDTA